MKNKSVNKGFSLVELIIYMGILSILILILTQTFNSILSLQLESEATSNVEQEGRYILARLMYDINRADSLIIPSSLGTNSSSLELQIAGVNYTYSLNNDNLTISNNYGTDVLNNIDSNIFNLNFVRLGNGGPRDTVKINFTVTSKIQQPKGQEVKSYGVTVGLR